MQPHSVQHESSQVKPLLPVQLHDEAASTSSKEHRILDSAETMVCARSYEASVPKKCWNFRLFSGNLKSQPRPLDGISWREWDPQGCRSHDDLLAADSLYLSTLSCGSCSRQTPAQLEGSRWNLESDRQLGAQRDSTWRISSRPPLRLSVVCGGRELAFFRTC